MKTEFDAEVAEIRRQGVCPKHKPYGKNKADCTPHEWAAHLEYRKKRLEDPFLREMHEAYRLAYLAKKGRMATAAESAS